MLLSQERGESYSKAQHIRALAPSLSGRTKAAIEMRHQNISAAFILLSLPWIDGYKPLSHGESLVLPYVEERIATDRDLLRAIARSVEAPVERDLAARRRLELVDPPQRRPLPETSHEEREASTPRRSCVTVNYLEREARNRSVGRAGEELVVEFERSRLCALCRPELARKVRHVALVDDGAGFDVLSFEADKAERLIEVKSTAYGAETPFFVTRHERDVSIERSPQFHLYRVFRLRAAPGLFTLKGRLDQSCQLAAESFRARAR